MNERGEREGRRRKEESRLTRYERKQSQPPIHSYEPKTFSHRPSRVLYHPFDHSIMELSGMLWMYEVREYRPVREFGGL
jgi:hypothetical protein